MKSKVVSEEASLQKQVGSRRPADVDYADDLAALDNNAGLQETTDMIRSASIQPTGDCQ